jgi:hypothetical protein
MAERTQCQQSCGPGTGAITVRARSLAPLVRTRGFEMTPEEGGVRFDTAQRCPTAPLLLARGAVVAAAAGNHDTFDGRLADQAGLAFAAVDAVLQLEETFFAVGVYII